MARLTTEIGRQKILAPNLGYDVEDGGIDLHAAINAIFLVFSDNITQKWYGSITLGKLNDPDDSILFTHNFNTTLAKLKLIFVISGTIQTDAQVTAKFTITQTSVNSITVENKDAVNPVTFDVYIFATKLNVNASDLESAFSSSLATKADAIAYALIFG